MGRLFAIIVSAMLLLPGDMTAVVDTGGISSALVVPLESSSPLLAYEQDTPVNVAGLAKLPALLTLACAMDEGIILRDTMMQVSQNAASVGGPTAFLDAGELVSAGELLRAAVMISAGDAIVTLAENAFGSEQVFLGNIHVTLKKLGVDKTLTGILGAGDTFTASELMRIGAAAAKSAAFTEFSACYIDHLEHADGRVTELVNANRMIRFYAGCFGLITGSSREAGYSGIFVATRNDMSYLCVVTGAKTSEARFTLATSLFDHVFANYKLQRLSDAYAPLVKAHTVRDGSVETVDLCAHETVILLLSKNDGELATAFELPEELPAPLSKDTPVGKAVFTRADGTRVREVELFPCEDVLSNGVLDVLRRLALSYLGRPG